MIMLGDSTSMFPLICWEIFMTYSQTFAKVVSQHNMKIKRRDSVARARALGTFSSLLILITINKKR